MQNKSFNILFACKATIFIILIALHFYWVKSIINRYGYLLFWIASSLTTIFILELILNKTKKSVWNKVGSAMILGYVVSLLTNFVLEAILYPYMIGNFIAALHNQPLQTILGVFVYYPVVLGGWFQSGIFALAAYEIHDRKSMGS